MDQWNRWIFASLAKYFKDAASGLTGLAVLFEHLDERTKDFMASSDTLEIRITGPYIYKQPGNEYKVRATVNLLMTSRFDGVAKNSYKILDFAGTMAAAMAGPIPLYEYDANYLEDVVDSHGNLITDNSSTRTFLGCLSIPEGQAVMCDNYGQIDTTDKVKVTEIEAKFEGTLSDD
jgi:hypothetical protein